MYKTLVDLWSGNYSLVCISGREMLDLAKRPEMDELYDFTFIYLVSFYFYYYYLKFERLIIIYLLG